MARAGANGANVSSPKFVMEATDMRSLVSRVELLDQQSWIRLRTFLEFLRCWNFHQQPVTVSLNPVV